MEEKLQIVHQVIVQHHLQKEVAREHQIGQRAVSVLVTQAQRNKKFLADLLSRRDFQAERHNQITRAVEKMIEADTFIDSVETVKRELMKGDKKEEEQDAMVSVA